MKYFAIIKIGYTAGIYGCSGEYFNLIYTTAEGLKNLTFEGMYGAEERIAATMKEKGYKQNYCAYGGVYGKLTRKDIPKGAVMGEYQALEEVKTIL